MHPTTTSTSASTTTTTTTTTTAPPQTLPETLSLIHHLLPFLLLSSLTIKSFTGRWQIIRTKVTTLKTIMSSLSTTPPHPLLHHLLPSLLSTLQTLQSLSQHCNSNPSSKLLTQSNLDMASSSLSTHIENLDILLKSGLLHQSNAIVLSQPGPCSSKEEQAFFIKDLFARLQIGGFEFKIKSLESLLQILQNDDKSAILVAKEGDIRYLVHLLDPTHPFSIREQALLAISSLVSSSESSRNTVFEEGGLGPLLRIVESGSLGLKEKAVMAVESITSDPENAWAVSAYGGVSILIEACRSGSPLVQSHAAGSIKNVAVVEEIRIALAEEGVVEVLIQLLGSGTQLAQEKAANCLWILASASEDFRISILEQKGLVILLQLVQESSKSDTLEHVLRAIYALLSTSPTPSILSGSTPFLVYLSEFIKNGNVTIQQISASILGNLSISDSSKRAVSGCIGVLVKMMECSKPTGLQESAAKCLISLLSVGSNRKELVRDEKSVLKLVQMLDPKNEMVCKKFSISVVCAILAGGSHGCRKKLVERGAYTHLQKLTEMEVDGAKKALHKLAGNRLKNIFSRTWRE